MSPQEDETTDIEAAAPNKKPRRKGILRTCYLIFEGTILVGIIVLILCGIWIFHKQMVKRNESKAIANLRMITGAQTGYSAANGVYAQTLEELTDNTHGKAFLSGTWDGITPKSGYIISMPDDSGGGSCYVTLAVPVRPGWTGRRSFQSDCSGVIRPGDDFLLTQAAREKRLRKRPTSGEPQPKRGEYRTFEAGEFVWIPPGTFMMGSDMRPQLLLDTYKVRAQHLDRWELGVYYSIEQPRHQVTLTQGFWMGKYEVTNGEFEAFVNATGYKTDSEKHRWGWGTWALDEADGEFREVRGANWRKPGWTIEPKQPVVCVSWNDAQAYIRWLNEKFGDGLYWLPTEAQWEYACRAGTDTEFFWGDSADEGKGYLNAADQTPGPNVRTYEGRFEFEDGYCYVAPVGSFRPNPWGLYDVLGNVGEHCEDWYSDYPKGAVKDPMGPWMTGVPPWEDPVEEEGYRVARGGSWRHDPADCRAAVRKCGPPSQSASSCGFRLIRLSD